MKNLRMKITGMELNDKSQPAIKLDCIDSNGKPNFTGWARFTLSEGDPQPKIGTIYVVTLRAESSDAASGVGK